MPILTRLFVFVLILYAAGCNAESTEPTSPTTPELKEVGSRGWFTTLAPFAEFDPDNPFVEIWIPSGDRKAPVMVYAHGGAGFREDDRARVLMFRRHGFATISFDSYEMNGFDDWNFVTRKIINAGKQNMIWGVFRGAVEYAATEDRWDSRNIFLYGASNGARVVLHSATELPNPIRGVIAEAPTANGYPIGDINIPTIIPFGKRDTWAGRSETDYIWTRTYPSSPISLEQLVTSLQEKGRPIRITFYENAGHSFHEGPLRQVTRGRANGISFTAYEGADEEALIQYERDIFAFVNRNLVQ
jgi:dienelactone hydrolase